VDELDVKYIDIELAVYSDSGYYDVNVWEWDEEKDEWDCLTDLCRTFHSIDEAETYVEELEQSGLYIIHKERTC
jgi:hypothetical protein